LPLESGVGESGSIESVEGGTGDCEVDILCLAVTVEREERGTANEDEAVAEIFRESICTENRLFKTQHTQRETLVGQAGWSYRWSGGKRCGTQAPRWLVSLRKGRSTVNGHRQGVICVAIGI
jgi:hypothetical protein